MLNKKVIKKKINKLIKKIKKLEYKYYILNETNISDYKYDLLIRKLTYLENKYPEFKNKNSPTNVINKYISNNLNKVKHISPMLSLKNTYIKKYIVKFNNNNIKKNKHKNKIIEYCCEYKLDGLAVNLIYIDGILNSISTRGNGKYGENIFHNINNIYGIPKELNKKFKIPYLVEIRGEICISNKNFFNLNKKLKLKNKKQFSNPRNAASGLSRQNKYIDNCILDFFAYGIGKIIKKKNSILDINSQFKILKNLNKLGFKLINKYIKTNNINIILKLHKYLEKNKYKLKYMIDGIVIKIDNLSLQKEIGFSNKYPNWAIAYKFKSEESISYIKNIKFLIKKSGVLIPIAEINEIIISGVKIKNIFLYNTKKIINLNIKIGDEVIIKRSGNVIPIIKKKLKNNIYNNKNKIYLPEYCPKCNSKLENINNVLKCINTFFCNAQIKYKIAHFFSKDCIFVKNLGYKTINLISKYININSPIDIFDLNIKDLIKIPYIKKKKAINIINNINYIEKISFDKFIYSLGISEIGKSTSIILSKNFNNINDLIKNYKNINNINTINKRKNKFINLFFNNKENLNLINKLVNRINIINNN